MTVLRQGAVAPESLDITVWRPADSTFDFTTVTGATFAITRPDGTYATWWASIVELVPTSVSLTHVIDPNEITLVGRYVAYATLIVLGGTRRSAPEFFVVLPADKP